MGIVGGLLFFILMFVGMFMAVSDPLIAYKTLSRIQRAMLQLYAINANTIARNDVTKLLKELGCFDESGQPMIQTFVVRELIELEKRGFLLRGTYSSFYINPLLLEIAVQDSIRCGVFADFSGKLQARSPNYGPSQRDARIAFYRGEAADFHRLRGLQTAKDLQLLKQFSRDIFDSLEPSLRAWLVCDAIQRLIHGESVDADMVALIDPILAEQSIPLDNELLAAAIDLAVARGDLELLSRLDLATQRKVNEIAGCMTFLKGDVEQAEACLGAVMPSGKSRSKLSPIGHLPALLYVLLLLQKQQGSAFAEARSILSSAAKLKTTWYPGAVAILVKAIEFMETPTTAAKFAANITASCQTPLDSLLAAYVTRWLITDDDAKPKVDQMASHAKTFRQSGLAWFAAEASLLAAGSKLETSVSATDSATMHMTLGVISLVDWIKQEPVWKRTLLAIAELGGVIAPKSVGVASNDTAMDRVIWELNPDYSGAQLEVFHQTRKGKEWSKGRKVALQRLYEQWRNPEFGFLTPEDRALCQTLVSVTERNHYGYSETSCSFDDERAAHALVGHPRIFAPNRREQPLTFAIQPPRLMVSHDDDGRISLQLDPKPRHDNRFQRNNEGNGHFALVFFSDSQLKLNKILGGTLKVPATAADDVLRSIQGLASLLTVHSAIEQSDAVVAATGTGETIAGDAMPHARLFPHQDGLRIEFMVRPLGDDGPFCRPGQGAASVLAMSRGKSVTARRDFAAETKRMQTIIERCSRIAAQWDDRLGSEPSVSFPAANDALESLLELDDLADQGDIVLHWPQGRHLNIAARASASQFKLRIKKDRDWFAASGDLKLDENLQLDLMQLVDLVQASPGRFVRLDDGRFLALSQQLRERIDGLGAFGQRRKDHDDLRFSRLRAPLLEELSESLAVRADKHWKEMLTRLSQATQSVTVLPSTLQTELRDYQLDGFRWMARLAEWGAGACLADDMGLGKTIQAIAILLHRAEAGPALIVAPTSVTSNWVAELQRFAPTLRVQMFGEGDRDQMLAGLNGRDVVICGYGLLHNESERLHAVAWQTLILDEAQAIKNIATQRSQAAMGLQADFRIILTGTPVENHLGELWNLFEFINPGLLGGISDFQQQYAIPIERDGADLERRRLKRLISPFILRRTKSQVLSELPSRTEVTLQVELSPEEAALYEALRQRAMEKLAAAAKDSKPGTQHLQILAEIMRLRRACCHPRLVLESTEIAGSKLALFSKTIDELVANRHKVLVFSQFVDHLSILKEELDAKGVSYQYLDGSTPGKNRKSIVDAFQAGEGDVFLISLKAGGVGLNLTAADYVIHMDPWWNPAVEDQASDRAHRMGQQRPVTIYRMITRGTIEERISQLHTQKRNLADSLLEGTDISGKLTADDLLRLIRD